jgi:hypothetical protein
MWSSPNHRDGQETQRSDYMLATNKPLMEFKFSQMLEDGGLFYQAAYDAYYKTAEPNSPPTEEEDSVNPSVEMKLYNDAKNTAVNKSHEFAAAFVKGLRDGGFDSILADEIDKHVKSAQIDINVPVLLPTIVSPMGPCTGSLSISTLTGAQITIS